MANRLTNHEVKIAFFSKEDCDAQRVSNETLGIIVSGIRSGLQRCVDRQKDVDMYCCLQGNRFIPNQLPIILNDVDAKMISSSDGNLQFATNPGGHILHVIFCGGASSFKTNRNVAPEDGRRRRTTKSSLHSISESSMKPSPTDSHCSENPLPEPRRRQPRGRNRRRRLNTDSSGSSSSDAEEMKHFSQLTGRRKR